ncbi:helix-turn-helix domain-containing protein [Cryobacterium roopkundense]|uniref:Putative Rossmann fold nucleotide-binding protein DprA/Smf involved in DNA uptake n=1 Tax=Cryobacterium roopkundense TaxID=1001240 RepID=A0A7W9E3W4_9MICO|nr:hypothetical protein [Cryobacterium roopkundense]MBB5641588.1 putative Rossmann fold nucleotide-binding protein DprA/Smf involved in DNA uptake [Cryobacterium roopkundense]
MAELVGERTVQVPLDFTASDGTDTFAGGGGRTSDQIRVFDALSGRSPRSVTEIARRSGLSSTGVRGALGALDLEGSVRERETGWLRAT